MVSCFRIKSGPPWDRSSGIQKELQQRKCVLNVDGNGRPSPERHTSFQSSFLHILFVVVGDLTSLSFKLCILNMNTTVISALEVLVVIKRESDYKVFITGIRPIKIVRM